MAAFKPQILLIGASGQLGQAFLALPEFPPSILTPTHEELDITRLENLDKYGEDHLDIGLIINCAAATDVETLEGDPTCADLQNRISAKNLAEFSNRLKAPLIHFSTDYVFDGKKQTPYTENDATNPINIYGKSKRAGEEEILTHAEHAVIFRTSWLISHRGENFLTKIIKKARGGEALKIVTDQIGSPTSADDLARMVWAAMPKIKENKTVTLYHLCNTGQTSWYDLAKFILDISGIFSAIIPIKSSELASKVNRPSYSALATEKFVQGVRIMPRSWEAAVSEIIAKIK
ncbi:MAG: dTDP-4-dehydrorhamnose reductase [Pseudobdellovibrionaceae bacterium]|jgi:dTDP-4-dehydrorhamnose reductase|nr:dTDP-4-dehydrorhamnose reductase [Pseudobdellovibrionaceae bacterium]